MPGATGPIPHLGVKARTAFGREMSEARATLERRTREMEDELRQLHYRVADEEMAERLRTFETLSP